MRSEAREGVGLNRLSGWRGRMSDSALYEEMRSGGTRKQRALTNTVYGYVQSALATSERSIGSELKL
jgi:hypothetical protein